MPIDKRVDFAAALDVSRTGDSFHLGFRGRGLPNALIHALRERGPKNLTLWSIRQRTVIRSPMS